MSNDQPGTGQPSWQPPQGEQPPPYGQPPMPAYGQPPVAPPAPAAPAYGQGYPAPPAYGQSYPAAPAYAAGGYAQGYAGPELASWGARVGASIIDSLVMNIPYTIGYIAFIASSGLGAFGTASGDAVPPPSAGAFGMLALGGLLTFGLWIWNRGIKQGGTGQSIGKKALGIRLLKEQDGQPMGTGMALVRDIVHIVDGAAYIGYLWPLWDAKKQTFADKILATLVVRG